LRSLRELLEQAMRFIAVQPVQRQLRVRHDLRVVGDLGPGAHHRQDA
jgi:hypothetical protein